MLIVALVLAVIGLAALVTAVVTSNELIAWVCIGASVIGVLLLVVDAVRERSSNQATGEVDGVDDEEASARSVGAEDYPEQLDQPSEDREVAVDESTPIKTASDDSTKPKSAGDDSAAPKSAAPKSAEPESEGISRDPSEGGGKTGTAEAAKPD